MKAFFGRKISSHKTDEAASIPIVAAPTQLELSKGIVVAVRIRPLSKAEIDLGHTACCSVLNGNIVTIKKDSNNGNYLKSQQGSVNEYCFDSAFDSNSNQYEVYEQTTKPFIGSVIDGYNVTVFAYGATGSGKTHTMVTSIFIY